MTGSRAVSAGETYRFGAFDVDPAAGELRKGGVRIRIQEKPLRVLVALLERPGEVVSRQELRGRLWPADVHVEYEDGLNAAVKRLRQTLGDTADPPRFIETIPKRGYRLLVPVETIAPRTVRESGAKPVPASLPGGLAALMIGRRPWAAAVVFAGVVALAAVGLFTVRQEASGPDPSASTAPVVEQRITVAVLPFENLTGNPDKDYLSDGFTEELITQLGRLLPDRLGVVARTSVMRYRDVSRDAAAIGAELGADFLIEGSVRAGDRLRITTRLIETGTGTQVWSNSYDRPMADVLRTQIEVIRAVGRALAVDLLPGEPEALARAATTSTDAYEACMRGLHALRLGTVSAFARARQHFEDAIADDPSYALALAGLAELSLAEAHYRVSAPTEAYIRAVTLAERAVAADPGLARPYATLAEAQNLLGDRVGAGRTFAKMLALNDLPPSAFVQYGWFLYETGRPAEALAQVRRAQALDPLSPEVTTAQSHLTLLAGRTDAALEYARLAVERAPDYPYASYTLGLAYETQGQTEPAIEAFEHAYVVGEGAPKYALKLGLAYAAAGRKRDAARMLEEVRRAAAEQYVPADELRRLESSL